MHSVARSHRLPLLALAASLSLCMLATACTTAGSHGIEVTRFHLGTDIPAQSINLQLADNSNEDSLEFRSYADLIATELGRIGYPVIPGNSAKLFAEVDVTRGLQQKAPRRSPVSVGVGAGSYGGRTGVSGGVSFPLGGSSGGEIYVTELRVQLIRRTDAGKAVAWEGTARREAEAAPVTPAAIVRTLATALFKDFPGESGRTIIMP